MMPYVCIVRQSLQSASSHVILSDVTLAVPLGGKKYQYPNFHFIDEKVEGQHDKKMTKITELILSETKL